MTSRLVAWFEDEEPRDLLRWALAACIVLGAYGVLIGGYFAVYGLWHPPLVGEVWDVDVELAPIDSVADNSQADTAPAPEEMVEQKPAPTEIKQHNEVKVEQPPPPDTTTADIAPPEEKKVEEIAPAPAPITTAPTQRVTSHGQAEWLASFVKRLQQCKRYPPGAQARGEEGVVRLALSIDRDGHVLARRIVTSSGHTDLDNGVLALVECVQQPLQPFPAGMAQPRLDLTVPIRFSLR
jgi:periplasmic protein TonB